MDALVLFSHGSLLCGAARPLSEHAARLRAAGVAPIVEAAFLNYTQPPLAEAVGRCTAAGATRICIVPFFLVPGRFVAVDLQRCLAEVEREHPDIAFVPAAPLGYSPLLADAVLVLAAEARPLSEVHDLLPRDPATCEGDPDCPLYETTECPRAPATSVVRPNARSTQLPNTAPASALLLLAHGSPRPTANEPFLRVVEAVRTSGRYGVVEAGFLDCNEPTIPQAADACVRRGAHSIAVVPFFLHLGTHVAQDLPTLLRDAEERHPGLRVRLGRHVGESEAVTALLAQRAAEALAG